MKILSHADQPLEEWRPGVQTRMNVAATVGASELCIFEQWVLPGAGAPDHFHFVEEVLTVLAGEAEIRLGGERAVLTPGQSLIVPAGLRHGFRNIGPAMLHIHAVLASACFEAAFDDRDPPVRRWAAPPPVEQI
ncbi:cupin domain-containing protein [Sinorhizobium mexicanum]|uniref:Cupin domain-containing protein n=1 Tax=Sinorhizobium mexicanum TaxID=375549 RepID=A0A859QCP8_9HYPH|nr:cupin domain-containing protein [Sinorhizobium mexicanum]MBP1887448.1 quercetin dioxygenase-like cupin family protein [Sinorhizobium mexicanum]QLL62343.1 cupin domain-containing protein [Sinorhizobium mexicanum]